MQRDFMDALIMKSRREETKGIRLLMGKNDACYRLSFDASANPFDSKLFQPNASLHPFRRSLFSGIYLTGVRGGPLQNEL